MKRPAKKLFLLILLTAVPLMGCGDSGSTPSGDERIEQHQGSAPIRVVCTTNIVKDLVRQIGGPCVEVTAIMDGPGIDPHTYTPSPKDTNALTAADLVVYSGLHLEGQFDDALESLKFRGIPVICVTEKLSQETPSRLIETHEGAADPHVWFSTDLWATCGECLAERLSEFDPANASQYSKAAQTFSEQLAKARADGIQLLTVIPKQRRVLVTAHDAFEYFARDFEFSVEAVQGISTDSEPGLRRINQLTDLLVEKKISAVFTEQSVSDKNITAMVANCKSKGHELKIGARLFSDTAGAEGTPEQTLIGALLHNITQIANALSDAETTQVVQ